MGTRASFWIGNPMEIENREWLGCIAWDGFPGGIPGIKEVKTAEDFRVLVLQQSEREDFAKPDKGWPFPWADNIFLTDYTYAFFDGKVQVTCFHGGFVPLDEYSDETRKEDTLPDNIPAPKPYDSSQPDSIIILGIRKGAS